MSGVVIMRELLKLRAQLTDLVPAGRIFVGALPLGAALPAVGITSVGGNEVETVARRAQRIPVRERVQVTVYAADYPAQERLLKAAGLGAGVHTGLLTTAENTYHVNSVLPLGTNPAIPPAGDGIYERSRDFMVTFKEAN